MKITETTDYSIFKDLKGNRAINRKKANDLMDSIREINLLEQNPIIVNENMDVIDGQHRLYAASTLQLPIFYTVKKGANLRTVQLINKNLSAWNNFNFLSSFIANDYEDYKILRDFYVHHNVGLTTAMAALTGSLGKQEIAKATKDFTSGDFKITHLAWAENFISQVESLSKYLEGDFWTSIVFLRSLELIYKEMNPDILRERVANSNIRLRRRPSVREYLRDFEEIVNYRQKKQVIRFLKSKAEKLEEKKKEVRKAK